MRHLGRSARTRLLIGTSVAAILCSGGAALAQDRPPIDIAPQPLAAALYEFGGKTGTQVIFASDLAGAKVTSGVSGERDERAAMTQLLAGTGLTFRREGDVFVIVAQEGGSSPQAGGAAGNAVQALIVTAQKREEDIQDVPIAISAFSQEDLTRSQVAGGPDLITQVPNMTFTKTNFSSYSIQLRGIGTQAISATTDPAVAVAFNNTPFIQNRFFEQEFYDLQRVEVLRGPQGTLYGRNATAGVVNIISAKPKFGFEARASADVSNFNSSRIEGMVNIPLVEDAVALRIAGAWTKRDGYATNELTGNPIDGRDLWSTRVSLRVSPNDRLDVNLIWEHFQEDDDRLRSGKQLCKKDITTEILAGGTGPNGVGLDVTNIPYFTRLPETGQNGTGFGGVNGTLSQGCQLVSLYSDEAYQTPTGLMLPYYVPLGSIGLPIRLLDPYENNFQSQDLRVIESAVDPDYRTSADLGELQVSFDLTDNLTLSSETAYNRDFTYSLQDFNRFNTAPGAWQQPNSDDRSGVMTIGPNGGGIFCDPQLGCSDRLVAVDTATAKASQFSQEFRLSSDFDGPFNFSLGANFLRADILAKYYVFINSISLIAASGPPPRPDLMLPYVQGQTDNIECIPNGYTPGNPNAVYSVQACVYIDPNPIGSLNDQGHNYFLSNNPYKLISYAAFGEAYYQITDNLKITGGLRWTVDKKEAPRVPTWILASYSVGYPVADVMEQEWREPTGRLTIDWKPDLAFTDETMVYASLAHGYKAGGANPPGFVLSFYGFGEGSQAAEAAARKSETRPRTFDAEFIDALEVGAKNTFLDGRATLNLAAFYYDYKDYQISEIVDRSAFNRNFDATVWGIEVEADWRPLENLRLGLKGGYEKTRIADGEQAIDLMDRTAGRTDWLVVRPFPTFASSCILPAWLYAHDGPDQSSGFPTFSGLYGLGGVTGGNPGGCELAYIQEVDPVTRRTYEPDPTLDSGSMNIHWFPGTYPGWNPLDESQGHNHGEGFFKPLGGNELPNAPNWTLTGTVDYTIPLSNDWLVNLHTDLHWQSESWWRVFNDHEFDKIDEYFTMNLAAIFSNEEAGWNVMAYVKNVTDVTAITGAFLNSDDTGLTTNVFLTEPRLYGLRVTKTWDGGPLLGSFGARGEGPHPFTVELGGQIQRHELANAPLVPGFSSAFAPSINIFDEAQSGDSDWGDGGDVKLTWRPDLGPWTLAAAVRFGETNGNSSARGEEQLAPVCAFGGFAAVQCTLLANDPVVGSMTRIAMINHGEADVWHRESYTLVDLTVGHEIEPSGFVRSNLSAGLRYAELESETSGVFRGIPDWNVPVGFVFPGATVTRNQYDGTITAQRSFKGVGPVVTWDASYPILDISEAGRVNLDWSISGGALFGDQEASFGGTEKRTDLRDPPGLPTGNMLVGRGDPVAPFEIVMTPVTVPSRSESATVPLAAVSLGLSYDVDGFTIGAGYRWERYFDAIDGGFASADGKDRTIDGPYFKIAVGFGG